MAKRMRGLSGFRVVTTSSPTSPSLADRLAGAGDENLDDLVLGDRHSLHRRGFVGDVAELGGGEGLEGIDTPRPCRLPLLGEERAAADHGELQGGDVGAEFVGLLQDRPQIVGRAGIDARADLGDHGNLLLGVADAGGNDRAAEGLGAVVHEPGARRQMVGKRVVDDVAGRTPAA